MDISKETYERADTDTKLNFLFDYMKATHDCIKGDKANPGHSERIRVLEASQKRLRRILAGGISAILTALGFRVGL